jgi:hypothetical protein
MGFFSRASLLFSLVFFFFLSLPPWSLVSTLVACYFLLSGLVLVLNLSVTLLELCYFFVWTSFNVKFNVSTLFIRMAHISIYDWMLMEDA